ncbi:rhodopsin, GQ-coupled-like [Strongylocentrotus purpuratus]|uniref:G-protein coupled receptors family 1 profile domain-containing protein n=1 Tax=Strongylocentrotus purpuratus TaxID=7668 RepID=A0A7M7NW44_STRPU|nr:rhodopsin, GQ-coupled-like [Strongylocentrotus purpuratus]
MNVVAFKHRAIVAAILLVFALVGLLGNALVIISVIVCRKLRTITNVLVVNLAFADFMACTFLPFQSAGLLSQTRRYPLHEAVCAAVAAVGYISVCCSVHSLVAIAFVRWYVITKSIRGHQGLHTPKKIAIMVVIIWIISISFMVVPPVIGIGTLGYSEYYSLCSLTDTNELETYFILLQGALIANALLLTLVFYIRILCHVLRHNKQFRDKYAVDEDTGSNSTEASSSVSAGSRLPMIKAINRKEIEITKNLFMVVCVFMLCFLATTVNFFIPGSSVFTLYSTMITFANSVVNPIIYGLKHPNFQEVFNQILCCRPVR